MSDRERGAIFPLISKGEHVVERGEIAKERSPSLSASLKGIMSSFFSLPRRACRREKKDREREGPNFLFIS